MAVLTVKNISKTYRVPAGVFSAKPRHIPAVRRVSLEIQQGTAVGLVGESGSGKSTVAKLILKLISADEGSMLFEGQDVLHWNERRFRPLRPKIQIVFQDPTASLSPRLRVRQIIAEPLTAIGMAGVELRDRVTDLVQQVGLHPSHLDRLPHQLSGGQRQRVSIARALATKPQLVVLDEAVSSLDVSTQAQILNLLKDLQERYGMAYLFIGHNLSVVRFLCHEVAVMYRGAFMEYGPTAEVYDAPAHPYTKLLLQSMPRLGQRDSTVQDPGGKSHAIQNQIRDEASSGCMWVDRCTMAQARCQCDMPPLKELGRSHRVWCWDYEK